jgi:hypothetical protein
MDFSFGILKHFAENTIVAIPGVKETDFYRPQHETIW